MYKDLFVNSITQKHFFPHNFVGSWRIYDNFPTSIIFDEGPPQNVRQSKLNSLFNSKNSDLSAISPTRQNFLIRTMYRSDQPNSSKNSN